MSLTSVKSLGEQKQSARRGRSAKAGPVFCPQRHLSLSVSVQAMFSPAMTTSPTGTYLPIRVVAPVGGPCQSHGPGIRISASCAQDKMPCSAAPWAPGHGGQDLEESTRSEQRKTYDTPVGPPAPPALGPQTVPAHPGSRTLFTSSYLTPVSEYLDETQVESVECHPDIHDSQMPSSAPLRARPQECKCPSCTSLKHLKPCLPLLHSPF